MSFTLCKAASVKDRAHLTCCKRLKRMVRNHVTKRVQLSNIQLLLLLLNGETEDNAHLLGELARVGSLSRAEPLSPCIAAAAGCAEKTPCPRLQPALPLTVMLPSLKLFEQHPQSAAAHFQLDPHLTSAPGRKMSKTSYRKKRTQEESGSIAILRLQLQVEVWHLAAAVAASCRCIISLALCWVESVRYFPGCSNSGKTMLSLPN